MIQLYAIYKRLTLDQKIKYVDSEGIETDVSCK